MSNSPMCCGMPATWNVVSVRLAFWVCGECKREVVETPSLPPPQPDEYEGWPILTLDGRGFYRPARITSLRINDETFGIDEDE